MGKPLCRAADVITAVAALALLSPLIAAVAACIRLVMGSPVLFRQTRPGKCGRLFTIYKFRTMCVAADGMTDDAARLTRLGRFFRRTSLDELPQLWNVLRGDMSLVGPRPLLPEYLSLYSPEQARRHEVRPGLTGWAQINGRNTVSWEDKFRLDVWYVDHQSFWLYLRILLLTMKKVVVGDGISQRGQVTVEFFRGSGPHREGKEVDRARTGEAVAFDDDDLRLAST